MDLKKRYLRKPTEELVKALEMQTDYTPEAIAAIKDALSFRASQEAEAIQEMALAFNTELIWNHLNSLDPLNDELVLRKSYFLSDTQVRAIYKEQFEKLIQDKTDFRVDSWNYAIGGI